MSVKAGVGTIKFLDPEKKRGVIAPQKVRSEQGEKGASSKDVYFEVSDDEALRLRKGQLVQYVLKDADEAGEITVLSDMV